MGTARKIHVLLIDPQVDFCDPHGSLFVPGAEEDVKRIANFIDRMGEKLDDVHVTLDQHHLLDISHPSWFVNSAGAHPAPFTTITADDLKKGTWRTFRRLAHDRTLSYLLALEAKKRYPHMIWPPHCLIGSQGGTISPVVNDALKGWVERSPALIDFVSKGSNPYTEHFGAVQAEVPDPADPSTQLNIPLMQTLEAADEVVLIGEAATHCVANTGLDIANNFSDRAMIGKLVFLSDLSSSVPNCDFLLDNFLKALKPKGMRVETSKDYLKGYGV